jgi:glycosyltransferase involved in cell wall biosynthesis
MADERPTVSVVVTTYYRNDLLRDALRSVRQQTHPATEIIVIDGSEEANAAPVVRGTDDVEYVPLERDPGPHGARSVGAERATGEYIQFLDDDDILHERKFEKQLSLFSEAVGVVYCGIRIHETGEIRRPDPEKRGDVLEHALRVRLWEPAVTGSLLIERSVLEEVLPLKNRHGCDDDGLMLELARRTEFDFVDEPLVDLRKDTDYSVSERLGGIEGRQRLLEMYADLYDDHPPDPRRYVLFDINRWRAEEALSDSVWSARAVLANARAAYHAPENRPQRVVLCIASLFGRPGVRAVRALEGRLS